MKLNRQSLNSGPLSFPTVNLNQIELDPDVVCLIPYQIAKRHQVLPLFRQEKELTLAMKDPSRLSVLNDIEFLTGLQVIPVLADEMHLAEAIEKSYASYGGDDFENIMDSMDFSGSIESVTHDQDIDDISKLRESAEGTPVVKMTNVLLSEAIRRGASDIHLEPYEKEFRIRLRIDGVLQPLMSPPKVLQSAVVSRIKIMSRLNIAERRLPQDGRMKVKFQGREIDFRISTLPSLFGEKVVLRLLDKSNLNLEIESLGFSERELSEFLRAIKQPWGMILVTGPTGSGKSTTLYSALHYIHSDKINILTVEDPVEYNMKGINQFQVHEKIGFTFAAALRAFLRQDPDVIMVGEIRDEETAEIAIKAALTGHLVFSTLHTNDAPSCVTRLADMRIEPYLISSSVILVMSQRLVKRLCPHCKVTDDISKRYLRSLGFKAEDVEGITCYKGKGCPECNETGYKGRAPIFEIMPVRGELVEMISARATTEEIARMATKQGMSTLRESGLQKIRDGITTLEEVARVTMGNG
jgi:type IV pilus assembly protein PilB